MVSIKINKLYCLKALSLSLFLYKLVFIYILFSKVIV